MSAILRSWFRGFPFGIFGDLSNPPAARFPARKAGSIRVVLSCVHPCPCWFKAVRMFGIKQALSVKSHEREHFLASKLGREPRFFAASLVPPMRQKAADADERSSTGGMNRPVGILSSPGITERGEASNQIKKVKPRR